MRAIQRVAACYPWSVEPTEELQRSLAYLGAGASAETVVRAGYGAGLLVGPVATGVAALAGVAPVGALAAGLAVALAATHAIHAVPLSLATMRRTAALGAAPNLVGRVVLRMRVAPAVESAAAFAADHGAGPLADSLQEHTRRAAGSPEAGLVGFADAWADWFPALGRAALLVASAAEAPPGERARTLDRAMDAVLDGTRDRMEDFADAVQGPATGLYAFGVLLPLALVSVLPAARAAGLPVTLPVIVAGYDLLLPGALLWAGWELLVRRPVAFRPPTVPPDHPDVPDSRWPALAVGAAAALAGWLVASRLVAAWAVPLLAAGWGPGAGLLWWYRPVKRVRDRTRAVEETLPDALYLVGRRVEQGTAVEAAIDAAAGEVSGPAGDVLAEAARRSRQLRVGVHEAFLGDHGPLATLPSTRARSGAATLALAARTGRPAGDAAVAMADHLEELAAVERDCRRSLGRVTDTLGSTAVLFAPLVGGVTVALADGMSVVDGAVEPVPVAGLGLAVGAYVLALAAVLSALAVGLAHGADRPLAGYRCGIALLVAPTVFLVAFVTAGAVA